MPRYAFLAITALLLCAAALAPNLRAESAAPYIHQTDMFGTNNVPPVDTVAWGFVRFYFSEDRRSADYTVDVKGYSGTLVTGADIRRGRPGANGPVIRHLADGGFITYGNKITFSESDLREMASGLWYVSLNTLYHPEGELRGQISLPADFLPALNPPAVSVPILEAPPAIDPPVLLIPELQVPVPEQPSAPPPQAVEPDPQVTGEAQPESFAAEPEISAPQGESSLSQAGVTITPPNTGDGGIR